MRGRGNRCHTEVVDTDGHVEPCGQPTVGTIITRDEYGQPDAYPACAECLNDAAMEGADDVA